MPENPARIKERVKIMKQSKKFYEIYDKLERANLIASDTRVELFLKLRRLERKNQRLCEMSCNGEGIVNGKFYRCDGSVKGAYLPDGETSIFDAEASKVEDKIRALVTGSGFGYTAEFQGDPRGYTVRIFTADKKDLSQIIFE
jgi:hypothetical protein